MEANDLHIRAARPDEAEALSHIAFRARAYWNEPRAFVEYLQSRGELSVTPEGVDKYPTYLVEDEESWEILGFYQIAVADGACVLRRICVSPEYTGSRIGTTLFLHACEVAETAGAEYMTILADLPAVGFFEEMGAETIGERLEETPAGGRRLRELRMGLV